MLCKVPLEGELLSYFSIGSDLLLKKFKSAWDPFLCLRKWQKWNNLALRQLLIIYRLVHVGFPIGEYFLHKPFFSGPWMCWSLFFPTAFSLLPDNPCSALLLLKRLLQLEPSALIPYMDVLVQALPSLLKPGVPRRVQTLSCELWTKINTVIPRK